jgi:tRNA dimethylallyltransferase
MPINNNNSDLRSLPFGKGLGIGRIIIIAGPTASGKTDLAIQLAQHYHTDIISADSRQCFRELNIGVAKPSQAQLAAAHHYFINSHSITENISAADFEKYALTAVGKIFEKSNTAIMCGGTGLYIKAFCEGLDAIPDADPAIKEAISADFAAHGIEWLQEAIQKEDPLFFEKGESQNPHRLMRALEVKRSTGKSILELRTSMKQQRPFEIVKICLDLPREILYDRINQRVDAMMDAGLEEEARALLPNKSLNALQTVGYRELFDYFEGKISLQRAVELIKQNTRNYAKRQVTWFKKDPEVKWLKPENVFEYCKSL